MTKPTSRTSVFQIRLATPADAVAISDIQVDTWRSTYRGLIHEPFLAALDQPEKVERRLRWLERCAQNQTLWIATTHAAPGAETPVGFLVGGVDRSDPPISDCEIYAFYVRAAFQRHGLGRKLMTQFAHRMGDLGYRSCTAWVLAANPAVEFYKKLGARVWVAHKRVDLDGQLYDHVAYGWDDLKAWLAHPRSSQTD